MYLEATDKNRFCSSLNKKSCKPHIKSNNKPNKYIFVVTNTLLLPPIPLVSKRSSYQSRSDSYLKVLPDLGAPILEAEKNHGSVALFSNLAFKFIQRVASFFFVVLPQSEENTFKFFCRFTILAKVCLRTCS